MTHTKSPSRALLLLLGALLATACVNPVSEGERPCPCAEGWTCCPDVQVCVANASQCERLRPPPVDPPVHTAPSAPRSVTASTEPDAAVLSWFEPESNGGTALTGYTVESEPREDGMTVVIDGRTARVTGLRRGGMYRFSVTARNAVGPGPAGSAEPVRLPDVPASPLNLSAKRGDGQASVTWEAPVSDGGLPVLRYVVTANPRGLRVETTGPELSAVVSSLTNGEATTFTVRAVNAVGESPDSTASESVVPAGLPAAPASVAATPAVRAVSVSWQVPEDTGGLPLSGYVVTASPGGARQEVDGATTSASFTGLENDTAYTFAVSARNDVGLGPDTGSAPALTPALPGAPTRVEATPDVRSLTVAWEPPASDGREPLTGYTVVAQPSGVRVDVGPDARGATLEAVPSTRPQTVSVTARSAVGEGPVASASQPVRTRPAPVELTSLEVPSEAGGCLSVSYGLKQVDGERVDVLVEVDADGDGTFTRATQAGSDTHSGLVALATSAEGTAHAFRWNRARDVPAAAPSARVRITATVPGAVPATRSVAVALAAETLRCELDVDSFLVQSLDVTWSPSWNTVTSGDFDRDGKHDLGVVNASGTSVLRGRGNGRFHRPYPAVIPMWGSSLVSADLDGDGVLDLLALDASNLRVARGRGDSTFQAPVSTFLSSSGSSTLGYAPLVRDMDGDGAPEVIVSQGGLLDVLRHTGGGALSKAFTTSLFGTAPVVAGDFDRDGREDLVIVGAYLTAILGQGRLAFSFEQLRHVGGTVHSAVAADFNGDGALDLADAREGFSDMGVNVFLNDGTGHFGARVELLRHSKFWGQKIQLTVGDLDGDGTQDLAYVHEEREVLTLLRGRGDGTFETHELPNGREPQQVTVADFDASGKPDLLVLSRGLEVRVMRDLEAPRRLAPGLGFVTADFDGDGWDDVASIVPSLDGIQVQLTRPTGELVARGPSPTGPRTWWLLPGRFDAGPTVDLLAMSDHESPSTLMLLRGNGDGTFSAGEPLVPELNPEWPTAGDVDGDGDLDLAFTDRRQDGAFFLFDVRLLLNQGDGTFVTGGVLATHASLNGLALADLNKDGRADLVVLRSVSPSFELGIFESRADNTLVKVREYSPIMDPCNLSEMLLEDLNRDGFMDVAVSCSGGQPGVLPMFGGSNFWFFERDFLRIPSGASGLSTRDLDGDGWRELLAGSPGNDSACILRAQGHGAYGPAACFGALPVAYDMVPLDVEHDGVPELLVGGKLSSSATLLRLR
ncbi:FG-GAP-like repeat-containing protein [Pyxidicoccus xibeiensis]|uniref:FG-GAP-like repeat-containing protein n=1 Tax=Pyxidicoccus xibeiensis TaxID=2906759 RepID=UPI0020A803A4|nr:FG-GAP-like repeat-containing protein [Pyxidicoccus xibeiensis]MCP3137169.1 FG-GAP-like repeat-containing protein [Pyxidicoccus xibeiensis]